MCLKAGLAEQKTCSRGQEKRWDVGLQILPGVQLSGAVQGQPYSEQHFCARKLLQNFSCMFFSQALLCDLPTVVCVIEQFVWEGSFRGYLV